MGVMGLMSYEHYCFDEALDAMMEKSRQQNGTGGDPESQTPTAGGANVAQYLDDEQKDVAEHLADSGKEAAGQVKELAGTVVQAGTPVSIAESGGDDEREREHDMCALKRLTIEDLRQQAPTGEKVLYVYDCAGIDYQAWTKWKKHGVYFISREKTNSALKVFGHLPYENDDPINRSILSDDCVGSANSISAIRRTTYRCPESNEIMIFITNILTTYHPESSSISIKVAGISKKYSIPSKHSYH